METAAARRNRRLGQAFHRRHPWLVAISVFCVAYTINVHVFAVIRWLRPGHLSPGVEYAGPVAFAVLMFLAGRRLHKPDRPRTGDAPPAVTKPGEPGA